MVLKRAGVISHSSWEEAALTEKEAMVKRLYLIHHDPDLIDEEFPSILQKPREFFQKRKLPLNPRSILSGVLKRFDWKNT